MNLSLVISEYLRTLKERNELDRLLPDLLVEMGYTVIARPQTGNRQFGVDIAALGINPSDNQPELLLLLIKQKDIGRSEWDGNDQAVRPSLNEIFDVYLRSHVAPEDIGKKIRIAVVTNGEMKQTIQAGWSGYANERREQALIEFWGLEKLSVLVERHLLDEHIFHDADRRDLRRALALSGDAEYERTDLHRLIRRSLGLAEDGQLLDQVSSRKTFLKSLKATNFATQMFASWALNDGDGRQGLRAMERAVLWSWHRAKAMEGWDADKETLQGLGAIFEGYLTVARHYFEKLQPHCYVENGLFGYAHDSAELSLVAFEQLGMLSSIGLAQLLSPWHDDLQRDVQIRNANAVAEAVSALVSNNAICGSPCFDRHSNDIILGMLLLIFTEHIEAAKKWIVLLCRNVDYSLKSRRFPPIDSDSIDDLADIGGWHTGEADEKLLRTSWMIAVLAGFCALLGLEKSYAMLREGLANDYPKICIQLWHPDEETHKIFYFQPAHFNSGFSEAPINIPPSMDEWIEHMVVIEQSSHGKFFQETMASKAGVPAINFIASRHFGTPIAPAFWYRLVHSRKDLVGDSRESLAD